MAPPDTGSGAGDPHAPTGHSGSPISQIPRPQAAECRGSTQDVDGAGIRPPPWGAEPLAGGTGKPVPLWGMSLGNVPKPKRTKLGSRKNETIRQHGAGSGRWRPGDGRASGAAEVFRAPEDILSSWRCSELLEVFRAPSISLISDRSGAASASSAPPAGSGCARPARAARSSCRHSWCHCILTQNGTIQTQNGQGAFLGVTLALPSPVPSCPQYSLWGQFGQGPAKGDDGQVRGDEQTFHCGETPERVRPPHLHPHLPPDTPFPSLTIIWLREK